MLVQWKLNRLGQSLVKVSLLIMRIWRCMNEVIGARDRELRVTEATGDRKKVTTPFLRVFLA